MTRSLPRIVVSLVAIGALTAAASAPTARVVLVAGGGTGDEGSPAPGCRLNEPFAVDFTPFGALFIAEMKGNRVLAVDSTGRIYPFAGTGRVGAAGDGGPARFAEFREIHSIAVGPPGALYVADTGNHRVRKIDLATGFVSNFAGTGEKGFSGDGGPASLAKFGAIYSVSFDPDFKTLYLADLDNRRVRAVDMATAVVSTVAGNGSRGVPRDGSKATEAPLLDPRAAAAGRNGEVYLLERGGHALRVVGRDGTIRTVAGTGKPGSDGLGGAAKLAAMNGPKHLCVDRNGSVLIADTENHRVVRYLPATETLVLVAGTGKRGSAGLGGPYDRIELDRPHGVTLDPEGAILISDSDNGRILKVVSP